MVSAELELGAAAEFMDRGGDAGAPKALVWFPVLSMTQDAKAPDLFPQVAAAHGGAFAAATAGEGTNFSRSSATKMLLSSSKASGSRAGYASKGDSSATADIVGRDGRNRRRCLNSQATSS